MNLLKVGDPECWENSGSKLTADNRKTESLAVPAMAPLNRRISELGIGKKTAENGGP